MFVVWHDNGIPGSRGYTEEFGELSEILARYAAAGIQVFGVDLFADQPSRKETL